MVKPNYLIVNYQNLSLEDTIKSLITYFDKTISDIAYIDYPIKTVEYLEKVEEIEIIAKNYKSDLSFYLKEFKNNLKSVHQDINFLILSFHENTWKEMESIKNSKYDNLLKHIKN